MITTLKTTGRLLAIATFLVVAAGCGPNAEGGEGSGGESIQETEGGEGGGGEAEGEEETEGGGEGGEGGEG